MACARKMPTLNMPITAVATSIIVLVLNACPFCSLDKVLRASRFQDDFVIR
jgi:hypothetical protein